MRKRAATQEPPAATLYQRHLLAILDEMDDTLQSFMLLTALTGDHAIMDDSHEVEMAIDRAMKMTADYARMFQFAKEDLTDEEYRRNLAQRKGGR